MNIFYVDESPKQIAKALIDKHIVKMPLETAQMLSTAHRLLDGVKTVVPLANGRRTKTFYVLPGETLNSTSGTYSEIYGEAKCYSVAHANHPSTVWTMKSKQNYDWHYALFTEMLTEYSKRYGKRHSCERLVNFLSRAPSNIASCCFQPPPLAMPEQYKGDNAIESYRSFYAGEKWKFAKWRHGVMPRWFPTYFLNEWDESDAQVFRQLTAKKTIPFDDRLVSLAKHATNV